MNMKQNRACLCIWFVFDPEGWYRAGRGGVGTLTNIYPVLFRMYKTTFSEPKC